MKLQNILLASAALFILSCEDDDPPPIQEVLGAERGAILRNIEYTNTDFEVGNADSTFKINIEEQDLQDGDLLDRVEVFVSFKDRTTSVSDLSTSEVLLKTFAAADFVEGPNGLPRTDLEFTYQEVLSATGLQLGQVVCNDQFNIRTDLLLTDGRSFSTDDAASSILTDDCFFRSPYRYVVNVVEPLDEELFTGSYLVSNADNSSVNTPFGPPQVVQLSLGHSPNTRTTPLGFEGFEFTLTCENAYATIYQSFNGFCQDSAVNILMGPDDSDTGFVSSDDDSVFIVAVTMGYEGWGGVLYNPSETFRLRFAKQ